MGTFCITAEDLPTTAKTVSALEKLELPSGVDIQVKLMYLTTKTQLFIVKGLLGRKIGMTSIYNAAGQSLGTVRRRPRHAAGRCCWCCYQIASGKCAWRG